ncbi:MAG: 4Fe-4S binding protein [Spirochaetota bacterium]|nr:MAG: 4Fe-4S binding protein [Spirochaetota bacterium]
MQRGFKLTGVLTDAELHRLPGAPSVERAAKGPVAVIECAEEFPCDPCEYSCAYGAIIVGQPIINLPCLDEDSCTGCGKCIAQCPGFAIFVMNLNYSKKEATVSFPYEFLPTYKAGEVVNAVNRSGKVITKGKVVDVKNLTNQDRTVVITIAVPKEFGWDVRGIERKEVKAYDR